MFDSSFQRSRLYFEVLQMLRLFSNYIELTGSDLQRSGLDKVFKSASQPTSVNESQQILHNDWELLKLQQKEAQERLMYRVSTKLLEVGSLRDAVCSQRFVILADLTFLTVVQCHILTRDVNVNNAESLCHCLYYCDGCVPAAKLYRGTSLSII
jgi:hypothetical protein